MDKSNYESALVLDCCNLEVGNWYRFCPRCGKKIDLERCKRVQVPTPNILDLFDYITWECSCGKGYERYGYNYCPICGKKRDAESAFDEKDNIQENPKTYCKSHGFKKPNTVYVTKCCNSFALDSWKYCPKCGKLAERDTDGVETNDEFDFEQTKWFCSHCGEGIPMRYEYCGKCGFKRSW